MSQAAQRPHVFTFFAPCSACPCSAQAHVCFGPKADIVRYLFFLAFAPLSLDQFCNVLVVVGNPPHDYFAFFVLKALCRSENFLGVEAPVLGVVSEIGGHGACHGEIGSGGVCRPRAE